MIFSEDFTIIEDGRVDYLDEDGNSPGTNETYGGTFGLDYKLH